MKVWALGKVMTKTLLTDKYMNGKLMLPVLAFAVLAGIFVNILFAFVIFVILYSFVGFDVQQQATGEITHVNMTPGEAILYGLNYL